MLSIISSKASTPNTHFSHRAREPKADNLSWINAVKAPSDAVELLLVGGAGPIDFRLRISQAHARHDLSPSHWSHMALLGPRAEEVENTPVYEVSLVPTEGFGFPAPTNGVQVTHLARYRDAEAYPNIALISVPCAWSDVDNHLGRLRKQRSAVDLPELVLAWLGFVWGVGRAGNPLLDGRGIPSAVLVETVIGASGINLSPGVVQSGSCPELVWQAAKWWQEFHSADGGKPLQGSFFVPHRFL